MWHKIVEYIDGATLKDWEGIPEKFLSISSQIALSISCPINPLTCNMIIRQYDTDEYKGICEQQPHGCDSMKLNKSEIALYDFNLSAFLDLLSAHLNINERKPESFNEFFNLWLLGKLTPHNQHHFQVFFLLEVSPEKLLNAFNHINISLGIDHYVIIVPSKNIIKLPAEQYCARKKIRVYSLEEIFSTESSLNIIGEKS